MYVQARPSGRLLSYDPATGRTTVLANDIWFANGVALSRDESFVAFVETNGLRVHRYWLKGTDQGPPSISRDQANLMSLYLELLPGSSIELNESDQMLSVAVIDPTHVRWRQVQPPVPCMRGRSYEPNPP